jgi:uncharacterized damage-inducible protein DinB
METVEHLRDLFRYDDWANRQTISALGASPSERSRQILAHLLITKQEYFERLSGKDSTGFDFWLDMTLEGSVWLARSTHANYTQLLDGADESVLERVAKYKTSEGVAHQNTYRQLLTHVLIHSSIHRGNIVLKMREEGLEPPKIDYILYLRETNRG